MTAIDRRVAVGAVVVRRDGRVLLVRRGRPPGVGHWTLPGGRLEAGESLAAAVVREIAEETGLCARVVAYLEAVDLDGEGFAYTIHEHLCAVDDEDAPIVAGDDAADARWATERDLEALSVPPAARAVIARALACRSSTPW